MNNEQFHETILSSLELIRGDLTAIRTDQAKLHNQIDLIAFQINGEGTDWPLVQIRQRVVTMWALSKAGLGLMGVLVVSGLTAGLGKLLGLLNWG